MSSLLLALKNLFAPPAQSTGDRDERFLAEATSLHDLERRMRLLDTGRAFHSIDTHGNFMR